MIVTDTTQITLITDNSLAPSPHRVNLMSAASGAGGEFVLSPGQRGTGLKSELRYGPKQRMPSSFIRFCLVKTKEPNYLMPVSLMSALVTQCPVIGGSLL